MLFDLLNRVGVRMRRKSSCKTQPSRRRKPRPLRFEGLSNRVLMAADLAPATAALPLADLVQVTDEVQVADLVQVADEVQVADGAPLSDQVWLDVSGRVADNSPLNSLELRKKYGDVIRDDQVSAVRVNVLSGGYVRNNQIHLDGGTLKLQFVNGSKKQLRITGIYLRNDGDDPDGSRAFAVHGPNLRKVPVGARRRIEVTPLKRSIEPHEALLVINTNHGRVRDLRIPLRMNLASDIRVRPSRPELSAGQIDHTFTIENRGWGTLELDTDQIRVTPTNDRARLFGTYEVVGAGKVVLQRRQATDVTIRFRTSVPGVYEANMEILSNDASKPVLSLPIESVAESKLGVTVSTVSGSLDQSLRLTNGGILPLEVHSASLSTGHSPSPFTLFATKLPTRLEYGESAGVRVGFHATEMGVYQGQVDIYSGDAPQSVRHVPIRVEALPEIDVTESGNLIADGRQTITVKNLGNWPLEFRRPWIEGPGAGVYRISGVSSQETLASGKSTTFTLHFDPPGPGRYDATLILPSNDPRQPIVRESRNLYVNPEIAVTSLKSIPNNSEHSLAFPCESGTVCPSVTMYFTVRNNGNMTLNLENVSLEGSGNFHLVAPTARSLRPGQQTNLQVTFHAAQTNTIYRTQLVIRSNDLTDRAFRVGLAASYYEPLYLRQLATRQAEQSDASQSLQYSLSAAPIADNVPVRLIAGA